MRAFKMGPNLCTVAFCSVAILLTIGSARAADGGSCYVVSDSAARAWCLAKAHKAPGACYAIQDAATRAQCLVEVRR